MSKLRPKLQSTSQPELEDPEEPVDDVEDDVDPDCLPFPPEYLIRQQQIANYELLREFLIHDNKNLTATLNDVRVSIDCLTKCVMQLTKTLEATSAVSAGHRKKT